MAVNCLELDEDAVAAILKAVLYEFPMQELDLFLAPCGCLAGGPSYQSGPV